LLVPSDKLDEDTAAAIAAVSQSSTGALRIRMHNKLAALVALPESGLWIAIAVAYRRGRSHP